VFRSFPPPGRASALPPPVPHDSTSFVADVKKAPAAPDAARPVPDAHIPLQIASFASLQHLRPSHQSPPSATITNRTDYMLQSGHITCLQHPRFRSLKNRPLHGKGKGHGR
jgi:hypothetical protein